MGAFGSTPPEALWVGLAEPLLRFPQRLAPAQLGFLRVAAQRMRFRQHSDHAAGGLRIHDGESLGFRLIERLDRSLHPNFSGGPAVDDQGRVLGINTSALSRYSAVVIPMSTVERVAAELERKGHVERGYLGVGILGLVAVHGPSGGCIIATDPAGTVIQNTCQQAGPSWLQALAAVVLTIVIYALPLLTAGYLAIRLRWGRQPQGSAVAAV